jgi:hypothetical protein
MTVGPNWKPLTEKQRAARLKWLRSQPRGKGLTLEDLGLLMCDDISRWSDDERASLRAKMLRHYGLAKSADGKPS